MRDRAEAVDEPGGGGPLLLVVSPAEGHHLVEVLRARQGLRQAVPVAEVLRQLAGGDLAEETT